MSDRSPPETAEAPPRRRKLRGALLRTALRLAVIALAAVLVNLALNWVLMELATPAGRNVHHLVVALSLLAYAALMAIPFVPGIEIGLSLLMMQGPEIAPFVFAATFTGLSTAYLAGRFMPYRPLCAMFADLGLTSASRLLMRVQPLGREERLALLRANLPRWLGPHLLRWRYLTVALALNLPGNAFIGGGGGIALIAGLSRMFDTRLILPWFALAVSPVPIMVYFFGLDVLALFGG